LIFHVFQVFVSSFLIGFLVLQPVYGTKFGSSFYPAKKEIHGMTLFVLWHDKKCHAMETLFGCEHPAIEFCVANG